MIEAMRYPSRRIGRRRRHLPLCPRSRNAGQTLPTGPLECLRPGPRCTGRLHVSSNVLPAGIDSAAQGQALQSWLLTEHHMYRIVVYDATWNLTYTRLSAQVYLELSDFVRLGDLVLEFTARICCTSSSSAAATGNAVTPTTTPVLLRTGSSTTSSSSDVVQ
jgi:hypothetical protein